MAHKSKTRQMRLPFPRRMSTDLDSGSVLKTVRTFKEPACAICGKHHRNDATRIKCEERAAKKTAREALLPCAHCGKRHRSEKAIQACVDKASRKATRSIPCQACGKVHSRRVPRKCLEAIKHLIPGESYQERQERADRLFENALTQAA